MVGELDLGGACLGLGLGLRLGTYTGIYDSNLNPLSEDTLLPELVHLGHDMGREPVSFRGLSLRMPCIVAGIANPMHCVLGNAVELYGPHLLDRRHFSDFGNLGVDATQIVDLDGRSFEELIVEVDTFGRVH